MQCTSGMKVGLQFIFTQHRNGQTMQAHTNSHTIFVSGGQWNGCMNLTSLDSLGECDVDGYTDLLIMFSSNIIFIISIGICGYHNFRK